jgi:hypothetical protein
MAKLTQHIPSFVDYRDPLKTATVRTLNELDKVDWVARWRGVTKFYRFSWSPQDNENPEGGGYLIVEMDEGRKWWTVASGDKIIKGLPLWVRVRK